MTLHKITEAEAGELTARHTKEPWEVSPSTLAHAPGNWKVQNVTGADGQTIATVYLGFAEDSKREERNANAERIVATINACAGMADPVSEIARLRQDKAELLAALEFYGDAGNYEADDWGVDSVIQPPEYGQPGTIARAALTNARKES